MTGTKYLPVYLMVIGALALVCVSRCASNVCATSATQTEERAGVAFSACNTAHNPVGVLPENHTQICGEVTEVKTSLHTPSADSTSERGKFSWRDHVALKRLRSGPSLRILFCTWLA